MQSHNSFIDLADKAEGLKPMKEVLKKKFVNAALISEILLVLRPSMELSPRYCTRWATQKVQT